MTWAKKCQTKQKRFLQINYNFLQIRRIINKVTNPGRLTTDLGRLYWIYTYIIPTHDTHQWLLLQFLVLLMMGAESVRNM